MSKPTSASNVMDQIINASAGSINRGGQELLAKIDDVTNVSSTKRLKFADNDKQNSQILLEKAEADLASSSYRPKVLNLSLSDNVSGNTLNNVVSVVKAATLSLEKAMTKNQLLRAQHADNPTLFMESELNLHEEITSLQALAALEDENSVGISMIATCYDTLIGIGTISSLVSLINSHENVDISIAVVQLMSELFDPSLLQERNEEQMVEIQSAMGRLAFAFLHEGGLEGAISNLPRLISSDAAKRKDAEEEEEIQTGIENVLTLIENLLDLDQMGVFSLASETKDSPIFFQSVVKLISEKSLAFVSVLFMLLNEEHDSSISSSLRLHASEILATIFQHEDFKYVEDLSVLPTLTSPNHEKNNVKSKPDVVDGMDSLLVTIAKYRKSNPEYEEDCECLENAFDALAATLLFPEHINLFLDRQGIELMLRCIREKVHSGLGALKILDFCLSLKDHEAVATTRRSCDVFVDAGGFKVLFPIIMGKVGSLPRPAPCTDAGNPQLMRKFSSAHKRSKRAMREKREWMSRLETHSINILFSLVLNLDKKSPNDAMHRLLSKFIEVDFEKCDRLVELCVKYDTKMQKAEYDFYKSEEAEELEGSGRQDELELLALKAKLLGGGELFYKLSAVVAYVAASSKRCHEHILHQLKTLNYSICAIKAGLNEYISILGSEQSMRITNLNVIDKI